MSPGRIHHAHRVPLCALALVALEGCSCGETAADEPPEAVVQRMLESQVRGDVDAVMADLAVSLLTSDEESELRGFLAALRDELSLSELSFVHRATMLGDAGTLAIVRFESEVTAVARGVRDRQHNGSVALMVKLDGAWKVRNLYPDEYLNCELWPSTATALRGLSAKKFEPLVDWAVINAKVDRTMAATVFDEGKLLRDVTASTVGGVPIMGDTLAGLYTIHDMLGNLGNLKEDIVAGRAGAAMIQTAGIAWGAVQVLTEPIPVLDHAADAVGIAFDQWHYMAAQRENYIKLQSALLQGLFTTDGVGGTPSERVLILYLTRQGEVPGLALGRIEGWKVAALDELTLLDDSAARRGYLLFDVGSSITIPKADSEAMYAAAVAMGAWQGGTVTEPVATLYVGITGLAQADTSTGTSVLRGFALRNGSKLRYEVSTARGFQSLRVRLSDGTTTRPVRIEDKGFNELSELLVDSDALDGDGLVLPVIGAHHTLRLSGKTASEQLAPLELTGLPGATLSVADPSVASAVSEGTWPEATITVTGLKAGRTELSLTVPGDGATVAPFVGSVPITVGALQPEVWILCGGGGDEATGSSDGPWRFGCVPYDGDHAAWIRLTNLARARFCADEGYGPFTSSDENASHAVCTMNCGSRAAARADGSVCDKP